MKNLKMFFKNFALVKIKGYFFKERFQFLFFFLFVGYDRSNYDNKDSDKEDKKE